MRKQFKNDLDQKYSRRIIFIHWLSAILIILLFPLGKYMSDIPFEEKIILIKVHTVLGFLIFILTFIRTILFFTSPRPPHLKTGNKFNDNLAMGVQRVFYLLMLAVSVTGAALLIEGGYAEALMASPVKPDLVLPRLEIGPLPVHNALASTLVVLILMHIVGVIRHIVRTKEKILKRIS